MHHSDKSVKPRRRVAGSARRTRASKAPLRYTVGLLPNVVTQVQRYAETADTSMSQAIGRLVSLGLEVQGARKKDFFKRLKDNLANNEPDQQDRLVDEFRALILGR
jgi:hypothetical protein